MIKVSAIFVLLTLPVSAWASDYTCSLTILEGHDSKFERKEYRDHDAIKIDVDGFQLVVAATMNLATNKLMIAQSLSHGDSSAGTAVECGVQRQDLYLQSGGRLAQATCELKR